ncbi:MAG: transaldolase [Planctomycetes bacterium]|nr:transaldolase [Planctomycetota bacterium]
MSTGPRTPRHDSALGKQVAEFCRKHVPATADKPNFPSSPLWAAVAKAGTSLWLDTGDIDAAKTLWTREFKALTTNNTLLNKEVQKGIYDELVPDAAALVRGIAKDLDEQGIVLEIGFILNAVHGLKLVRTFGADVSVELHTALANDTEASYQYGKRFAAISPDRFIVKVPLTPAGIFAARRLVKDGIRVNFTLGFSARQNFLIGVGARATWVNVFMGRINAFVADNKLGDGKNAGEKATIASQKVLGELGSQGITVKQIGASMRSGQQVQDLVGLDVFTIPTAAAKEFVTRNPPLADIRNHMGEDPPVTWGPGADAKGDKLDVFWQIDDTFRNAMAELAKANLDTMTGADLMAFLQARGVGDLFPMFTADEQKKVGAEGKIPVHATWKDKVRAGKASWDGILTAAALASFTQDQTALDERIQRLL